jgi:hypothetical protein
MSGDNARAALVDTLLFNLFDSSLPESNLLRQSEIPEGIDASLNQAGDDLGSFVEQERPFWQILLQSMHQGCLA